MPKTCPFCDINVETHGIECENCHKWVHYACSSLPSYMLMQLSKSKRQYTCETCVLLKIGAKYPTLLTDIEEEIEAHKLKLTAPLLHADITPTDTPPIPTISSEADGTPVIDNEASSATQNITTQTDLQPNAPQPVPHATTTPILPHAPHSRPCRFYLQGNCRHGKKGSNCSFLHPPMCFKFIGKGDSGCSKGSDCKFVHPKLCRSSLLTNKCERRNCHFYHVTGSSRPNIVSPTLGPHVLPLTAQPTPLMQMKVHPPPPYIPTPAAPFKPAPYPSAPFKPAP